MTSSCNSNESLSIRDNSEIITNKSGEYRKESQDKGSALTEDEGKEVYNTITNLPPQITKVKIMPEVFKPGDTLYIEAEANDPDRDDITIFYEWYKNGELISNEKEIKSSLKRGDKILIKLRPFDGKNYGKEITFTWDILNIPPVIEDHRDYYFDGNLFTYQVKAHDPDGDELKYSIKKGPQGMSVDSTGLVKWNVPPEYKGKAQIIVSVTDGHGGEVLHTFDIDIGVKTN